MAHTRYASLNPLQPGLLHLVPTLQLGLLDLIEKTIRVIDTLPITPLEPAHPVAIVRIDDIDWFLAWRG